jgi:hypothetical protein
MSGPADLFLTRLGPHTLEMQFSTFFGGSGDDTGWGLALDRNGNPVVAGITDSRDLPGTMASLQPANAGRKDAFIALFRGRTVTSTYFGGSADDESGYDGGNIALDGRGNVWVAGITYSNNLPVRNAQQPRFGGGNGDGFVAAFTPDLKKLCFSTYHGDAERNLLEGLAISPSGLVAVTGVSFSEKPLPTHSAIGGNGVYAGANILVLPATGFCRTD